MTDNFDPNLEFPPNTEWMVGECTSAAVTEPGGNFPPPFARSNLVVDPTKPFTVTVDWEIRGFLSRLWLTALAANSPNWRVEMWVESQGPGDEILAGSASVPVLPLDAGTTQTYQADIVVPANTLDEHTPGLNSGVYGTTITMFLDSTLGGPGYDITGVHSTQTLLAEDPS
jgi:hypothetical protein